MNFNKFSGEQLDKMIGGDETDKEISRRLDILNPDQIKTFLKKSSGCHFSKFSDLFYAALPLSRLEKDQVKALFDDDYGRQKDKARHHLQLVSLLEISNGLHLLSDDHLKMLSKEQITALDYSNTTSKQIDEIFTSYKFSDQERAERISLIPIRFINDVLKINNHIVKYLSKQQCQQVNPELLDQKAIHNLFPGYSFNTIHPGYEYTIEDRKGKVRHKFERRGDGFVSMHSYSQREINTTIEERKKQCIFWAQRFSGQQLKIMKPKMFNEVQELLSCL